jgi:Protein of unknown function (DUF3606)
MVEDPRKPGANAQRVDRIDVSQDYECRYWSRKFGVTPAELKAAVAKAGPMIEDIARELGKSGSRALGRGC